MGSVLLGAAVVLLLIGGFIMWRLNSAAIEAPQIARYLEKTFKASQPDSMINIGSVSISSATEDKGLDLIMDHVSIQSLDGKNLFIIPKLRTAFSPKDLVTGNFAPTEMIVDGAALQAERTKDGTFSFAAVTEEQSNELGSIDSGLEKFKSVGFLKKLEAVRFLKTDVRLQDRGTERTYSIEDGNFTLAIDDNSFTFNTDLQVTGSNGVSSVIATLRHELGTDDSELLFQFQDLSLKDAAEQFPTLNFLQAISAPVSGSVSMLINPNTPLGDLSGVLEIKSGVLIPEDSTKGFSFDTGKVYFNFQGEDDLLFIDSLTLNSEFGDVQASGVLDFARDSNGSINAFTTILDADRLVLNKGRFFENQLNLEAGQVQASVQLAPFQADIEKLVVWDNDTHFEAVGKSWVANSRWQNDFSFRSDIITSSRLLKMWPLQFIPKTRSWLDRNVKSAEIVDVKGTINTESIKPAIDMTFALQDVETALVKTMGHLNNGFGTGHITSSELTLRLDKGFVTAPNNQRIEFDGTEFHIPDTRKRPANAVVTLAGTGTIPAALSLLDIPKFQFIKKAGLKTNVAKGDMSAKGTLNFPLKKGTKPNEILFKVGAKLSKISSDLLIKGRSVTAKKMNLSADNKLISLNGNAIVSGVSNTFVWKQPIGKGKPRPSTLSAEFGLNKQSLDAFNIALPNGFVNGNAVGKLSLTLKKDAATAFELESNLNGAALNLPSLSWSKPKDAAGKFSISGTLGSVPQVKSIELSAYGLKAKGDLSLSEKGTLKSLRFSSFQLEKWINAPVEITPSGTKSFNFAIRGGTIDLRKNKETKPGSSSNTLDLRPDRLIITDGITLTNMRGNFRTKGGIAGKFQARINGGAVVVGELTRQANGSGVFLTSANAGRLLRSANLLKTAYKGDLQLQLSPNANGHLDGSVKIKHIRVKQTNALASLLNTISGVGLLQQLGGEGIHFATVEGDIMLRPNGVQISELSAVGPSMGMTLNGWYKNKSDTLDLEGVVTPLYAINGVFERVFKRLAGRQKGEGLFSFTYKMRGPSTNPKVSVNPLSILTPGAFRNIFRRPIPVPEQ